jgi:hypothetical protein
LWCFRGGVNACCDDSAPAVAICREGDWQCPEGTVEGSLCCGFGANCERRASDRPECPPSPGQASPDAREPDAAPSGPLCTLPLPDLSSEVPVGFSAALPGPATPAHVTSVSPHLLALALDGGGELSFNWPSAMPDLAAGDAVVLDRVCQDYRGISCWDVVKGPRTIAATFKAEGFSAVAPPKLHGFTFGLAGCVFWAPPSFGVPGQWATLFDLFVALGSETATVPVLDSGELGGWRFENFTAVSFPGVEEAHYVWEGGGSVIVTASGPP